MADTFEMLQTVLTNSKDLTIIKQASTTNEVLKFLDRQTFHFLLLELELTGSNLEFWLQLKMDHPDMEIIIVSRSSKYALNAYQLHPYDYLLKPLEIEAFEILIQKLILKNHNDALKRFHSARMFVKSSKEILLIPYDDIVYIEKINRESIIHTASMHYNSKMTLLEIEAFIPKMFLRVHKSYIVNLDKINKVSTIGDRTYELEFENTQKMALMSRHKAVELFSILM